MEIKTHLSKHKASINKRITSYIETTKKRFKSVSTTNSTSFDMLRVFACGGKGVRGGLFIETAQAFEFTDKKLLIDIAATLELLHSALLIHDDIIDRDVTRRGNPSLFAQYIPVGKTIGSHDPTVYGTSMGICGGDIGFFVALDIFQKTIEKIASPKKDQLYKLLFQELITVVLGQMDDITFSHAKEFPNSEKIISMYTYKTAHYTFSLPFILAATLTEQSESTKRLLEKIGVDIGILFQIRDDEIGLFSTESEIGKPIGSDIRENKKTILRIFLEKKLSQTEKKVLQKIIKFPSLSQKNIKIIHELLYKYNVKEFTEKIKTDYFEKAIFNINRLDASQNYKDLLFKLTEYIVKRTS